MEVIFIEDKHQYLVDGKYVPSVTQLVATLGADYDEQDDDYLELTIEAAAERGTVMHAYIAHRLQGGAPEDFEMPDSYAGYAEAVDKFLAEHSIVPYLIETPLGKEDFAGTPDLVAEYDGALAILDWKFVSQVAKSKVGAQLGGYYELCESNDIFPVKLAAVQFLRDGTYRVYPADISPCLAAFSACRTVYGWKTINHKRGRIFT